jgi:hypothetical protein
VLKDFYAAFAPVCFTLLGLWLIVVQTRHAEWRWSSLHRRRAYAVSLHFSLPGLMSLMSLVDSASTSLWRVSFAVIAGGGALVLVAVRGPAPGRLGSAAFIVAVVLYALVAVVAIAPGSAHAFGHAVRALRVEAILLSVIVFLGANVAWLLLFENTEVLPPEPVDAAI